MKSVCVCVGGGGGGGEGGGGGPAGRLNRLAPNHHLTFKCCLRYILIHIDGLSAYRLPNLVSETSQRKKTTTFNSNYIAVMKQR